MRIVHVVPFLAIAAIACSSDKTSGNSTPGNDSGTLADVVAVDDTGAEAGPDSMVSGGATTIGAAGGTVAGPMGSQVVVPAGAVATDVMISIGVVTSGFPAIDSSIHAYSAVYALTPHGQQFMSPVTVSIPFTGPSGVALYTADPAGAAGSWQTVSGATVSSGSMQAQVSHFSFFFVGGTVSEAGTSEAGLPTDAAPDTATVNPAPDGAPMDAAPDRIAVVSNDAAPEASLASDAGSDARAAASFTCGQAPTSSISIAAVLSGAQPPSVDVTSTLCAAGASLAMPFVGNAAFGQATGTFSLAQSPQYLTFTARDGSAVPLHSAEFTPPGFPNTSDAGTDGAFFGIIYGRSVITRQLGPTGFAADGGTSAIINVLANVINASTCRDPAGTTISLVGTAHPEAVVYYQTTQGQWTTTGPLQANQTGIVIVLTPTASPEYVQVQGTKSGCTVDTGITTGTLRTEGFSGRVPVFPGEMSQVVAREQ